MPTVSCECSRPAGCTLSQADLTSRITSAINTVRSAAPAGVKIVMPSYCVMTALHPQIMPGCDLTAFARLVRAMKAAADAAADVTFIDATAVCGCGCAHGESNGGGPSGLRRVLWYLLVL